MSNANEPAFPSQGCDGWGLTKRELIAAILGAGLLTDPKLVELCPEHVADGAVEHADALLVELDKPQEQEPEANGN